MEVRLGIATCLYRLGQISTARQALQRVLQLDPHNADALYALAVLRLDPLKGESAKLVGPAARPGTVLHAVSEPCQGGWQAGGPHCSLRAVCCEVDVWSTLACCPPCSTLAQACHCIPVAWC